MSQRKLFDGEVFARRIRRRMADLNVNLKEACEQIGCPHASLSRICNGKAAPDVENYLRIEKWLAKGVK